MLIGVIFVLFTVGLVVPCVLDVARTPSYEFDLPSKQTWMVVVIAFWVFGAAAWLFVGRRDLRLRRAWYEMTEQWAASQEHAPRRHPSGYAWGAAPQRSLWRVRPPAAAPVRFVAPDDNPAFLLELDRRIQDWREEP